MGRVNRRMDLIFLIVLSIVVGVTTFFSISNGHNWGDDFSAYIQEGIALAEGTFEEQTNINAFAVWQDKPLTYVWGYPLSLSLVYRLVGFDRVDYSSIIYYKIPSALFLVVLCIAMYCFFRQFFSAPVSFGSTLVIGINPQTLMLVDQILSDIQYAALCVIAYLVVWKYSLALKKTSPTESKVFGTVLDSVDTR